MILNYKTLPFEGDWTLVLVPGKKSVIQNAEMSPTSFFVVALFVYLCMHFILFYRCL